MTLGSSLSIENGKPHDPSPNETQSLINEPSLPAGAPALCHQ